MCQDPNAGARARAQAQINEKNYRYGANSVKYWNKETTYKRGKERAAVGLSSRQSDAMESMMNALGKAKAHTETISAAQAAGTKAAANYGYKDIGQDRKAARSEMLQFLSKQKVVDAQVNELPRQLDKNAHQAKLEYLKIRADNRQALGEKPDWGAPVLMPKQNTGAMILSGITTAASVAAGVGTLGAGFGAMAAGKFTGDSVMKGLKIWGGLPT